MERYLIVIDLDGTLLQGYNQYDEKTFQYLRKLNEAGHIIMLATGRPKRSSYFVYQALNLHSPLINYNGALISNPCDINYPKTDLRINKEALFDIIKKIRPFLLNVFCEIYDDIYVEDYNDEIHPYLHTDGGLLHTGPLEKILPGNPNSALFFLEKKGMKEFQNYVKTHYDNILSSRAWEIDNHYIGELFNKEVDKSIGFLNACKYYGILEKNTIAIGDGHNDLSLLKKAHIGVAMENANPELFNYASVITSSVSNQGVLKFLQDFFGEEPVLVK